MSDENVGRVLAQKYELVRLLGRGGMGAVYEGRNQIGKRVAVKLLVEPELIHDIELITRFFREAQAAAAVESKHVVDVYDTGVDEEKGFPFMIMSLLTGEDLEHLMRRVKPIDPIAAARIASQAAAGLAKAHDAGIVHRDVKPGNLFLAEDEGECVVKILDFGIAKLGGDKALGAGEKGDVLTKSGAVLGTPLYMSPEQAQGLKTIDARTDVWSLGMCLYHALAGRLPFTDTDTLGKVIVAIVTHEVPSLSALAPWVRPELASVVHQALERDVAKRIPSARRFLQLLAPFTGGSTTLTPDLLSPASEALGDTLSLLPGAPSSHEAISRPHPTQDTIPSPIAATTAGVASARRPPSVSSPRTSGVSKAIPLALGAFALLAVGGLALRRTQGNTPVAQALPTASAASTAPAAPSTTPPPAPNQNSDETKVGVLSLKIPDGYTVKVDGAAPGTAESHGASRLLDDGRLELRGEFQSKFLVAVFDKTGKRVMVQVVYLYDNKLDPEAIDTTVGEVTVAKPKSKPPSSALPARF